MITEPLTTAQLGYSASIVIAHITADGGSREYAIFAVSKCHGVTVRTVKRWLKAFRQSALGGGVPYAKVE